MIIENGAGDGGYSAKVNADGRLHTFAVTESIETMQAIREKKYSVSTGKVAVTTGKSAIVLLTNTGTESIFVAANVLTLFNQSGTQTAEHTVGILANSLVDTGTFTELSLFNWSVGSTRAALFEVEKGSDGATLKNEVQEVTTFIEAPVKSVANGQIFVVPAGSTFGVTLTLGTGITAADVVWEANIFENGALE